MKLSSVTIRLLATCLADGDTRPGAAASRAPVTFRKLRDRLSRVIGGMGFTALLQRSIAIAKSDVTTFADIDANALFTGAAVVTADPEAGDRFVLAIATTLVSLLAAFIGVELSRKILREVWPQLGTVAIEFAADDDEESST